MSDSYIIRLGKLLGRKSGCLIRKSAIMMFQIEVRCSSGIGRFMRIINLFAQRDVTPQSIMSKEIDELYHIDILIADMEETAIKTIIEKMRTQFFVAFADYKIVH